MKQETKNLISWIKELIGEELNRRFEAACKGKYKEYTNDCDRAIEFLDTLPEIESKLCQGGYIQDKNGTPCCHGDKIIVDMFGKKVYTLEWNPKQRCFCFVRLFDNGCKFMNTLGENFFTKVE